MTSLTFPRNHRQCCLDNQQCQIGRYNQQNHNQQPDWRPNNRLFHLRSIYGHKTRRCHLEGQCRFQLLGHSVRLDLFVLHQKRLDREQVKHQIHLLWPRNRCLHKLKHKIILLTQKMNYELLEMEPIGVVPFTSTCHRQRTGRKIQLVFNLSIWFLSINV